MSTSSGPAGTMRLQVAGGTRATEIFVIDASYALVTRALGTLDTRLNPGLYKIKVREGDKVQEEPLLLQPGSSSLLNKSPTARLSEDGEGVRLEYSPQRFASAAPLEQTSRSHEYQRDAAENHSRTVHAGPGGDSQIFFFTRWWTTEETRAEGGTHPAAGLALHDLTGRLIVDLAQEGVSDFSEDPWAACNVALPSGTYCLHRAQAGEDPLDHAIVAAPGWQTQIFLLSEPTRSPRAGRTSAVLLARIGAGFDPRDEGIRLTDLARWGLANSRVVVDDWALDAMTAGKFENPMLGILAGHLLLQRREEQGTSRSHTRTLVEVLRNLRSMLGPIPDVEALALALDLPIAEPHVFDRPPMLSNSWSLIVQRSMADPDLIAPGSPAWRILDRVWLNPPWLAWAAIPGDAMPPAPSPEALESGSPPFDDFGASGGSYPMAAPDMHGAPDGNARSAPEPPPTPTPAEVAYGEPAPTAVPPTPEGLAEVAEALRRALAQADALPELTGLEESLVAALAGRGRYVVADPNSGRLHLEQRRTASSKTWADLPAEAVALRLEIPPPKIAEVMTGLLRKLEFNEAADETWVEEIP